MSSPPFFLFLADLILSIHVLIVVFIIGGLAVTLIGKVTGWQWVRNPWFRLIHLLAIGIVVIQSWFGHICSLTVLEMHFRHLAGQSTYSGSFIAYWLGKILYIDLPFWIFILVYSIFGALVVAAWFWVKPRSFRRTIY